ncbi:DUF4230 domain-containing protein [Bacillus cereus]|uniref:Uncharacterized protein n=1 Tax=Bacillus cereus TaxID=1396 RepID=A0A164QCZ9_BACCE|nr:DUF4230 domain-containing protein [Bacillus cereus]KZD71140.1 hypothetical protein B4088_0870 [Bacillus cereus]
MRKLTKYSICGVVVGALIFTNTDKIAFVSNLITGDKVAVASLNKEQQEKIKDGTHEVIITKKLVIESMKDTFEYTGEEINFKGGATFVDRKGAIKKRTESNGLLDDITNSTVNIYADATNRYRERAYKEIVPIKAKLGMDTKKLTDEDVQIRGNDIYIRLKDPALIAFEVPYEKGDIDADRGAMAESFTEKERQRYHGVIAKSIEKLLLTGKLPEKKQEDGELTLDDDTVEKIKEIRGKTRLSLENNLNSWNTKWNIKDAPVFHVVEEFDEIETQNNVSDNNEQVNVETNDDVQQ